MTGPGTGMERLLGGWELPDNTRAAFSFDEAVTPGGIFSWNAIPRTLHSGAITPYVLDNVTYRVYAFEVGRQFPVNQPAGGRTEVWAGGFNPTANATGVTELTGRAVSSTVGIEIFNITNNTRLMTMLACAYADVSAAPDASGRISFDVNRLNLRPGVRYYLRVQAIAPDNQAPLNALPPAGGSTGPAAPLEANLPFANSLLSGVTLHPVSNNVAIGVVFPTFTPQQPGVGQPGVGVGGAVTPPQEPAEESGDDTIGLPTEEVEYVAVEPGVVQTANEAVSVVADAAAAVSGAAVVSVSPPILVEVELPYTVATVTMPEGVDTSEITTMAILNPDGTLTAVPTRIDDDGNVVVLLREDAVLVALNVQAAFIDIGGLAPHVIAEINEAASLKIVEGRGGGIFDPLAGVTGREAVTMVLRAIGVPTTYRTSVATAVTNGFVGGNFNGALLMTRVEAARLITNILDDMGLVIELTQEEIDELLADFIDLYELNDAERFAMAVVVKNGIFHGVGGGRMLPFDIVTRSQMASLAVRTQEVILLEHWTTLREWM